MLAAAYLAATRAHADPAEPGEKGGLRAASMG
jgi:hypothetical protein